eukprot:INCI9326.2.p1 GENE.INCI9326.2~~INCI9326.2.p1  ORF type:complete len:451 (+),score=71.62 INCI9326.2:317-1669(+)
MPQQEKTTQQREQQEQEKEQQQRFAEQQQRFVDQQQLVHQQQQQQLLALQRQLLEAQAQIGYVPLHMQAYGGTLPSMGSLVGHYPMSQFGPYGFMAYDAVPGTANAAAYNAFRFPHMFHGAQVSTGLPLQYYAGASGAIPPAVGESHFSAQGQFHQQVTQPEDSSAEQTGSTPHPRKRTFRNVNSRSCSDHNDVSAEENCQADVETATHAAGDIHSNGVLLSDIIKSGIIKAGENNLTLTYKGVTVRLHLSSIGSIIWPEDKAMGRREQQFLSPTACATTIRRTISPGASENSGWRFIKYDGVSLADWKKRYLAQHNEGSEFSNRSSKNESRTAPRKAMRRQYRKVDGLPDAKYGATAGTLNRDYGQNFDPPPSHFGSAESDSGPGFSSQQSIDSNSNGANCNELAVEYDPDDELTLAEAVLQWEENGRLRMERIKTENEQAKMSQGKES